MTRAAANRRTLIDYAGALGALGVGVFLRYALDRWMGDELPFVTIFGAVAAAVWFGGVGPAVTASILGYLACDYLFIPPRLQLAIRTPGDVIGLAAYLLTCALVIVFGDAARRAHHAVRQTERERTRQLLDARLLASIIESSDDGIVSKSLDGIIQSWNIGAERIFGFTAEQAVGRHISLIIPPERLAEEDDIIASLKAGRRVDHFETERRRADGGRIQVSLTISPIKDDTGRIVGASKIARDVTRQRQTESERQKFVTLVENSTDFIGICDLKGVPFYVNRAGLDMVGLADLEQASRTTVTDFFFPEDQPRIMDEFLPAVRERGHGEIEIRFRHFKTGEARWMAYKVLVLPDASGRPVAYATVSQDVTERRRLTDSLRALAEDLSEADRRKNEFLAMLAHELRNPLAPISNAARALRLGGLDPDTLGGAADLIERQVRQMSRLVEDLLDISRISRGRIELRKQRVELAPIVHHAVEAVRAQYRTMNHELVVALPPQPLHVDADAARLAQVVGNLLNNACKFTDKGGRIWLTVEEEVDAGNGQAVIRVRDTGIGIAAADLARVFDMFEQVDTSLERSRDGLGLGLTLVKTLAELHGGRVDVYSEGPARGSEFVVHLPLAPPLSAAAPQPPMEQAAGTSARRILIVDDNEDGAESLSMMLELAGHKTYQAYDGPEGIEAARRLAPDVVLLDIGLPGMSGYEVCRRVRSESWGRDLVMVALTGWGQQEDRDLSREAGFDAHMVKPVDLDGLLDFLNRVTSLRAAGF